ncbi:MAG TPA: SagB/ThcOx family dehydrogenase [Euryarchaeota archaeon]|nr:SagB/ThcOx family dehydrogenase [Euryarchaeota archaeon]
MSRNELKDTQRKTFDFSTTDQNRGVPMPPVQKPVDKRATRIDLPDPNAGIFEISLKDAIARRKSWRTFLQDPVSIEELSFLLWATQGVRDSSNMKRIFRTVPSAGNRHAFETYLAVFDVEAVPKGLYRYLPLDHALAEVQHLPDLKEKVSKGCLGQDFVKKSAVTFIWTTVPYRMEWRYGEVSHKVIALDAGHVCQNLYLACEAIKCGTCAIGAYDQELMDSLLNVDGEEEFVIYIAPVGRVRP